ncbi:hypothetical protein Pyn_19451 [Prunus yedoensis var. nudiflora]|uniref:Uncharacterized protein n=1 Tax=Prunus yedoensis var. nudiflora TaxID=2094558 RepID=A0A314ZJR1_PRUYE|nr:hypothetical protein Pyn_19451 [Prunus yedoensis var. nudiflora]
MNIILGDMAQKSHSYFRPNWHAASSSLYCYQLEAFVDMLGSCSSECLTNRKSQLDLLAEVVEELASQNGKLHMPIFFHTILSKVHSSHSSSTRQEVVLVAWFNGDLRNFPMFGGQSNSCRQPCMISESKLML